MKNRSCHHRNHSLSSTLTGLPFPLPRLVNHSLMASARRVGSMPSPTSRGTFRSGQGIVEFAGAGEIPHAKAVEPIERHGTAVVADHDRGLKLSGVH